jgi:hypothetical protein
MIYSHNFVPYSQDNLSGKKMVYITVTKGKGLSVTAGKTCDENFDGFAGKNKVSGRAHSLASLLLLLLLLLLLHTRCFCC